MGGGDSKRPSDGEDGGAPGARRSQATWRPEPSRGSDPSENVLEVGARLTEAPSAEMVATAFAFELEAERHLAEEMGLADLAHTVALLEGKLIPDAAGRELLGALLALQETDLPLDPALGDLYTNREAWLAGRTPAVAWLGTGRARREATTVAHHLAAGAGLLRLARALVAAGRALVKRAVEEQATLVPDYTYLQAAQPTMFGHYLLAFVYPMLRDLDRLRALHARTDRSPAGCGSANGSRLAPDRARLAELLGFGGVVAHARDAMWQADGPIEAQAVVVAALVNADRLAEDLMFLATAEVGIVELADAHARASKIMPHKKNPYALAYVRAVANRAIGVQAALAASGRTPSGQVDNRLLAYGEVPRALAEAAGAIELLAAVVARLRVDPARAAEALARSFTAATDVADALVLEAGLDARAAQRLVGRVAANLAAAGRAAATLTPDDLHRATGATVGLSADALARALDPAAAVGARTGPGGAARAPVDAMIADCRDALATHDAWRAARETSAALARRALLARAGELAAP